MIFSFDAEFRITGSLLSPEGYLRLPVAHIPSLYTLSSRFLQGKGEEAAFCISLFCHREESYPGVVDLLKRGPLRYISHYLGLIYYLGT